ncbi:MAG: hypothetical protein HYV03_05660 [Deltaproteobacteria bacterium]|nr:hypothetical protein [Deltaproteobacteria bacterium]
MVEKIDRPEAPPAYQVVATTATKDDRGQGGSQPQAEDEFSSPGTEAEWRRLRGPLQDRKLLRVRREDIRRVGFRRAVLQAKASILEIDVELVNGQILERAHFVLPRLDEYWQWKGYPPGQDLPLPTLLKEPYVEISVPQQGGVPQTHARANAPAMAGAAETRVQSWWSLWDVRTGDMRPIAVAAYVAVAVIGIVVLWVIW